MIKNSEIRAKSPVSAYLNASDNQSLAQNPHKLNNGYIHICENLAIPYRLYSKSELCYLVAHPADFLNGITQTKIGANTLHEEVKSLLMRWTGDDRYSPPFTLDEYNDRRQIPANYVAWILARIYGS